MPRPNPFSTLTPDAKRVYEKITAKRGQMRGGPFASLMHHPALAEKVGDLGEFRRFGRIGHGADRVDEAGLQPAGPVLQPMVASVLNVRRRRHRDERARTGCLDGCPEATDERRHA